MYSLGLPRLVLLPLAAVSVMALAQALPPTPVPAGAAYLATALLPAEHGRKLKVSSPAFAEGSDIPFANTGYRGNVFPGLSWSKGPRGTRSYVAVLQDADGLMGNDIILHWTTYNIPAATTKLPVGMTEPPRGAVAGPNRHGPGQGYLGPKTGPGPKHRYPFQVFALDIVLPAGPGLTWPALKDAMRGHVLASGQTVGLGRFDPTAPATPPR